MLTINCLQYIAFQHLIDHLKVHFKSQSNAFFYFLFFEQGPHIQNKQGEQKQDGPKKDYLSFETFLAEAFTVTIPSQEMYCAIQQ